jgi:hypothetical protein
MKHAWKSKVAIMLPDQASAAGRAARGYGGQITDRKEKP